MTTSSQSTAPTIEERLARIERMLTDALRPAPRLLSKRAAAKLLGIDRGTTLETLIRDGYLRLVMGKIPAGDLERLLANGLPEPKRRAARKASAAVNEADEIAKIDV